MIEKNESFISSAKTDETNTSKYNNRLGVSNNKRFAQNASIIWSRILHGRYDFAPGDQKAAMAFANAINLHFASRKKSLTFVVDRDGDLCKHYKFGRTDVYFPLGQWNEALPVMLKVLELIRGLNRD